jgi:23S rRNA (guanine2445-N2)-methyltransferase / 23S rRNA (guanine2069-N7)-methyltransferase
MLRLPLYATASRGTEPMLAAELEKLGAKRLRQDRGGVRFMASLDEILRVCVHSRVAMRVLYPMGTFESAGAEGLYDAAHSVPWEEWLTTKTTFAVEATLKNSEHDHSGFVALKLKDGIVDRLREKLGSRPDVDSHDPVFRVVAHLSGKSLSLSLDLCGTPLFMRGTKQAQTIAPLKETLAAAMLIASGYEGEEPLADPMCGSGTIITEAGAIATRRAPGLKRGFALERWPQFSIAAKPLLDDLRKEAQAAIRPAPFPLLASDYDVDALTATTRNVASAGLTPYVRIEEADVLHAPPPEGPPGLLITNPPYGERLGSGGQKGMKSFFFTLGNSLKTWQGWRLALLAGNPAFESAFHRRPSNRMPLWNGPIECELLQYRAAGSGPTPE